MAGRNVIRQDRKGQRGSGAHELVDEANAWYKVQGRALIERVEPGIIGRHEPEGLSPGEVAGKLRRSTVDYRGGVLVPEIGPPAVAIAFDLKATQDPTHLDVDPGHASKKQIIEALQSGRRPRARAKVPPHQVSWLTDAERCTVLAFWLVQFTRLERHFVLPHTVFRQHYVAPWKIPLVVFEAHGIEVRPRGMCVLDYLAAVPELLERYPPRRQGRLAGI